MTMQETMRKNGKQIKQKAKEIFSSKNIARMAVFTTLAYILYFPIFEFSLIPAVPFLKIDFSNTFVMMAGFALGPIAGLIVGVLKELLHALTFSQTVGVGELANIIIMLPYVLIPSIIYLKRRNIKTVFITLAIACVTQAVWSVPVNYLLTFPFFLMAYAGAPSWSVGMDFYLSVWYWAVLFNFVKTLFVSAAVLLLYKHFQRLFNYIFSNKRKKPVAAAVTGEEVGGASDSEHRSDNDGSPEKYIISTPEEMESLGESLSKQMSGGEVILLSGELGAGKTVFCKGIAKGLDVSSTVVSPTFTIMNEYDGGRLKFCHFDAYRLEDADEAYGAGLTDFIGADGVLCAVEWWENVKELFDGIKTVKIEIKKCGDSREVEITK